MDTKNKTESILIKPMRMFDSKTNEELLKYIESMSNGPQRALAYTIYGLTWNMMAKELNGDKK